MYIYICTYVCVSLCLCVILQVVSGLEVFKAVEAGVVDRGGGEEDAQAVVMECGLWDHESMLAQG